MPTAEDVRQQRQLRARFINALWDLAAASGAERTLTTAVLETIGVELPDAQIDRLTSELLTDGLIGAERRVYEEPFASEIWLTSSGRREVEQWIDSDSPTPRLPLVPSTIFHTTIFGGLHGSAVVVGSDNSTVMVGTTMGSQLREVVDAFRQILEIHELEVDDRDTVETDLSTLRQEVESATPDKVRVRVSLKRLMAWAGAFAATNGTALLSEEVQSAARAVLESVS